MYTLYQTQEFQDWLDGLNDRRAQVRIAARLRLAEGGEPRGRPPGGGGGVGKGGGVAGNLGDWQSVGGEVSEMRVDFGPGYRLYFTRRGKLLIVMLAGGDKSSQKRDINRAQRIAATLE